MILNHENRKRKLNGIAQNQAQPQPTSHCSTGQPQLQVTNKEEVLKPQPPPTKETVYTRQDVPAYFKKMPDMDDVEILDLTTETPSINIDETSQDTNYSTNSPNSTQDINSTEEGSQDDVPVIKKCVSFPIVTGCMMTINCFEEPQVCFVHSLSFRVYAVTACTVPKWLHRSGPHLPYMYQSCVDHAWPPTE